MQSKSYKFHKSVYRGSVCNPEKAFNLEKMISKIGGWTEIESMELYVEKDVWLTFNSFVMFTLKDGRDFITEKGRDGICVYETSCGT